MIREVNINDIEFINKFIVEFDNVKITVNDLTNKPFDKFFVYCQNGIILGFLNYSIMYERSELNYLLVNKDYRLKGIASKLMKYMINDCKKNDCINVTLEVKENNIGAITLYEKFGFQKKSIRKKYYGDIDGIMMERMLVE